MIKDKLQICLITYNRKCYLKHTLDKLTGEDSPLKDVDIIILDNASTDGSSELIDEYCAQYSNMKHIRRKINIGGNANICRAFELGATSGKEYFWVLCDDDDFDWTNWNELESAIMQDKYDLLFTCTRLIRNKKDIAQLLHQATFIPGCIYSSKRLTDEILQNIYNTINLMFSQVMLSADIICRSLERVYIVNKDIIIRPTPIEEGDSTIVRGRNVELVHPDTLSIFWHIGFIKAVQIVKDKKIRDYIVQNVRFTDIFDQSFYSYLLFIIDYNYKYKNNNVRNLTDLFLLLNTYQKMVMLLALFSYYILYRIIYVYKDNKGVNLKLFNKLKFRIYSSRWFENIFSIKNENGYKILSLLWLKLKIGEKHY